MLVNRPLNAIGGGQLHRLADFPEREHPPKEDIDDLVHDLALQEGEFKKGTIKELAMNPQAYDAVKQLLSLGVSLQDVWDKFGSIEEWRDVSQTILAPRIQYVFDLLRPTSKEKKEVFEFLSMYAETADEVMEHITNYHSNLAYQRSLKIHETLARIIPANYDPLSLSQKAVLMIRSIAGIPSVLVGMRSEEYVDDVLYGLQAEKIPNAEEVWNELDVRTARA